MECGDPVPWFRASVDGEGFAFHLLAGHYTVVAILDSDGPGAAEATTLFRQLEEVQTQAGMNLLIVSSEESRFSIPGVRVVKDVGKKIAHAWGCLEVNGRVIDQWLLIDPRLRLAFRAPHASSSTFLHHVSARTARAAQVVLEHAPVLFIPDVFTPALCQKLIGMFEKIGGEPSGFMRRAGDSTELVHDTQSKRRSDVTIIDHELRDEARAALRSRVIPEIEKVFQYRATRIERDIVALYSADQRGFFKPHRDNMTPATEHRRFAATINLNSDYFTGGELRFPEFGSKLYRPETGAAMVFSCGLLHEVTPVVQGLRYAYLPFFYDDASHQLRSQRIRSAGSPDVSQL